jgi:cytochrome c oxidase subunit 1
MGMPRRVYTYLEELGWGDLNLLATAGAYLFALGILITAVNALWSARRGPVFGALFFALIVMQAIPGIILHPCAY